MKHFFQLFLFLIFTNSAQALVNPDQLYGSWQFQQVTPIFSFSMLLDIQGTHTTFSNTCAYGRLAVTVSTTVSSRVTDNQLIITTAGHDEKSIGKAKCHVDIKPTQLDYQIQNQTLILSGNGAKMYFTRMP